jgi:hypothetical protein
MDPSCSTSWPPHIIAYAPPPPLLLLLLLRRRRRRRSSSLHAVGDDQQLVCGSTDVIRPTTANQKQRPRLHNSAGRPINSTPTSPYITYKKANFTENWLVKIIDNIGTVVARILGLCLLVKFHQHLT